MTVKQQKEFIEQKLDDIKNKTGIVFTLAQDNKKVSKKRNTLSFYVDVGTGLNRILKLNVLSKLSENNIIARFEKINFSKIALFFNA